MFQIVIQLTENHRVAGNNSKQHRFLELLKRLRTGDSTEDDWHLLLTQQPSKIPSIDRFSDALRLFSAMKMLPNTTVTNLMNLENQLLASMPDTLLMQLKR